MYVYDVSQIYLTDRGERERVEALLHAEGLRLDRNLDYTCGIYDDAGNLIATGSCSANTLRCLAVSRDYQGEGLMNKVISHLIYVQSQRGNTHLFLYTKCSSARYFRDLGFYEIIRIKDQIVFMENRARGFSSYLDRLKRESGRKEEQNGLKREFGGSAEQNGLELESHESAESLRRFGVVSRNMPDANAKLPERIGAVVMNANPFTLGHRYLIEVAAKKCDVLHVFILSEDTSLFPFSVRKKLVMEGTRDIPGIRYHDSGPYIISNATFPSYFQKDEKAAIESHARLDLEIFSRIAAALGITDRFVGEEPRSVVTSLYNDLMQSLLPERGIECHVIPRRRIDNAVCAEEAEREDRAGLSENGGDDTEGMVISASDVRRAIQTGDEALLNKLLPESTLSWLHSQEAVPVIDRIRRTKNVIHY